MRGVVQGLTSRGAAVTAGVTVASQGRDAGLLTWLRTHKLAPRRGRSNHSEGEAYETNQWKTHRQRDVVDARAGVQSRAIGQAALTCVRGHHNGGANARPARRRAPSDRPRDRPRARRSLRVDRHDRALEPQALRVPARHTKSLWFERAVVSIHT